MTFAKTLGNIAVCPSPHSAHHLFFFFLLFSPLLFLSSVSFFPFFFFLFFFLLLSLNKVYLVLVKGAELAASEMGVPLPSPGEPWCFLWALSSWHQPCARRARRSPCSPTLSHSCLLLRWLGLPPPIPGLGAAELGQTGPDSARGYFAVSSSSCRGGCSFCKWEPVCSQSKHQICSPGQLGSSPEWERRESGSTLRCHLSLCLHLVPNPDPSPSASVQTDCLVLHALFYPPH